MFPAALGLGYDSQTIIISPDGTMEYDFFQGNNLALTDTGNPVAGTTSQLRMVLLFLLLNQTDLMSEQRGMAIPPHPGAF